MPQGIPGVIPSGVIEQRDETVGHGDRVLASPIEVQIERLVQLGQKGLSVDVALALIRRAAAGAHPNTRQNPREDGSWDEAIAGTSGRWEVRYLPQAQDGLPAGCVVVRDRMNDLPFVWSADMICVGHAFDLLEGLGDLQRWDILYRPLGEKRWHAPWREEHLTGDAHDCAAFLAHHCHIDLTREVYVPPEPEDEPTSGDGSSDPLS